MKRTTKTLMIFATMFVPFSSFAQNFYEQRYRGWLWFEEPTKEELQNSKQVNLQNQPITPAEAKEEIEQFARELEDLRFVMMARPTPENVRAYREKEKLMWDHSLVIHDACVTLSITP